MALRALTLTLLALATAPAGAQFRATPMRLPVDTYGAPAFAPVVSGLPANDLLVFPRPDLGPPLLRPYRSLLARPAVTRALDPVAFGIAAGFLGPRAPGAVADLAFPRGTAVTVGFGATPQAPVQSFPVLPAAAATVTFARLLPRDGDVLVAPALSGAFEDGFVTAIDLAGGPPARVRSWATPAVAGRIGLSMDALPLRLSPTARALGVDDLAICGLGEVELLLHAAAPGPGGLDGLQLTRVRVGDHVATEDAPWLPAGMLQGDVLGAGTLDVDFDGVPDLVLSLGAWTQPSLAVPRGLVWIRSTGALADYGDRTRRWGDLRGHPDLSPLENPMTLRPLTLGGAPAIAVFDRGRSEVLVVTSDRAARRLRVWRGAAQGVDVTEIALVDVVGSPAPDLIAKGAEYAGPQALLVYPDAGDAWPELAWAPGSPGQAARGLDHVMAVEASDADGPLTVEWLLAGREDPPAATGPSHTLAGSTLCDAGVTIPVRVRATDDLGVFAEVEGAVEVVLAPPALALAGATPPGRLPLPPGGTSAVAEAEAWTGCGRPVTFTWSVTGVPGEAGRVEERGDTWTRLTLTLPEASYPGLLAAEPALALTAVDDLGLASPEAVLPLALDASGLVRVSHSADRAVAGAGDVVVLRTELESRLGVPLDGVVLRDRLVGLAAAGPPVVTGAAVTGRRGADLTLDTLPPAGAVVIVEQPVRTVGQRTASAVEVRSAGGHLLTPAAGAPPAEGALPGCGCGAADAGGLLALLGLAAARRRRPAT